MVENGDYEYIYNSLNMKKYQYFFFKIIQIIEYPKKGYERCKVPLLVSLFCFLPCLVGAGAGGGASLFWLLWWFVEMVDSVTGAEEWTCASSTKTHEHSNY